VRCRVRTHLIFLRLVRGRNGRRRLPFFQATASMNRPSLSVERGTTVKRERRPSDSARLFGGFARAMGLLEFVNKYPYPDRDIVHAVFSERDLPTLLYLLTQRRARSLWDRLVPLVMHLGNAELSVPILIEFVEQNDSYLPGETAKLNAKSVAVYALGLLGGDKAEAYLRSVITKAGAECAAALWIRNDLPDPYRSERNFIVELQRSAASGLVDTGNPENIAVVEQFHAYSLKRAEALYQRETKELNKEERDFLHLFDGLAEALVKRDVMQMMAVGSTAENITRNEIALALKRYSPRPLPEIVSTTPPVSLTR